jgi:hypothetical protein
MDRVLFVLLKPVVTSRVWPKNELEKVRLLGISPKFTATRVVINLAIAVNDIDGRGVETRRRNVLLVTRVLLLLGFGRCLRGCLRSYIQIFDGIRSPRAPWATFPSHDR